MISLIIISKLLNEFCYFTITGIIDNYAKTRKQNYWKLYQQYRRFYKGHVLFNGQDQPMAIEISSSPCNDASICSHLGTQHRQALYLNGYIMIIITLQRWVHYDFAPNLTQNQAYYDIHGYTMIAPKLNWFTTLPYTHVPVTGRSNQQSWSKGSDRKEPSTREPALHYLNNPKGSLHVRENHKKFHIAFISPHVYPHVYIPVQAMQPSKLRSNAGMVTHLRTCTVTDWF